MRHIVHPLKCLWFRLSYVHILYRLLKLYWGSLYCNSILYKLCNPLSEYMDVKWCMTIFILY